MREKERESEGEKRFIDTLKEGRERERNNKKGVEKGERSTDQRQKK